MERSIHFARARWVEATAVVLACAGVVEGLSASNDDGRGPGWLLPLVVPLMAAPLLLQGRFPFGAPVASVVVADVIAIATDGNTITDAAFVFFLLFLVAWLFGRLEERRSAVTGLAVLLVSVVLVDAEADELQPGNIAFPMIFLSLFWGASFFVHARAAEARQAQERARRLELEQETATRQAIEAERQRIARELHDVIAHSVSVMTVQAGAVRRLLQPEQEREREALLSVETTGREALTEMRRLVGLLEEDGRKADRAPQPSMRALDILLGTVREAGLQVELDVEGRQRDLPPGVDLNAYRLLQEALTNALKSAGNSRARVALRWREQELELEVESNARQEGGPHGGTQVLAAMRERVALVGGTLETETRDGGGLVVRCHLPLPLESAA